MKLFYPHNLKPNQIITDFLCGNFFGSKKLLHSSNIMFKIVPTKGKSKSSQEWLTRQLNDYYVKKSRYDRYRCRSAYKLLEIDQKYSILKPGYAIVDCGAAPGSWTQVAVQKLKLSDDETDTKANTGIVVAVDLQHIIPVKGAAILKESDFTSPETQAKITELLTNRKADVIMSDMAPKATGNYDLDTVAIMRLVYAALKFAVLNLRQDGTFLAKIWDNAEVGTLTDHLQKFFTSVKRVKPEACRTDSAELYLLARGFRCDKFHSKKS